MTPVQHGLERRVQAVLEADPPRVPVLLGVCGSGRTFLLERLRERLGPAVSQYVDVERSATTPERFLKAVLAHLRVEAPDQPVTAPTPRGAFDAVLHLFEQAHAPDGGPVTFLLDEVLEFRTFENFPGLRHVMRDLLEALGRSRNRFVLTSRYVARGLRMLRDGSPRFEVIPLSGLSADEIRDAYSGHPASASPHGEDIALAVQALTDGRAGHAREIVLAMREMGPGGGSDPVSALAALMAPRGALARALAFSYELRLHRARGYGALKAILDILAVEEALTLTEIAHRLQRTPGSTKDYLSWLEDVDLVRSRSKRYSYNDPLLRLWVRLHCRPSPPDEDTVAREVQQYAMARLPHAVEPAMVLAGGDEASRKPWGIIEID